LRMRSRFRRASARSGLPASGMTEVAEGVME
jgi:hypothetical protein